MAQTVEFFLRVKPFAKGNANRIHAGKKRRGKKRQRWIGKTDESRAAEQILRILSGPHLPIEPWPRPHPIRMDVTFVFEVPGGWPDWKKEAALDGRWLPTEHQLGDRDNLHKTIGDALEAKLKKGHRGLYEDDSQITDGDVRKRYGPVAGYQVKLTFMVQEESPSEKAKGYDYPGKGCTFGAGVHRIAAAVVA